MFENNVLILKYFKPFFRLLKWKKWWEGVLMGGLLPKQCLFVSIYVVYTTWILIFDFFQIMFIGYMYLFFLHISIWERFTSVDTLILCFDHAQI